MDSFGFIHLSYSEGGVGVEVDEDESEDDTCEPLLILIGANLVEISG